jgi:predicted MFS family arabinose efflux permease
MILLPAIGSQIIAMTSLFLLPVLINDLQTNAGLSGRIAGLLLSMELVVSAITTLYMSVYFRSDRGRRVALFGGCLTVASTLLTLLSPSLPMLFATRFAAGMGAGIVGAQATSVLARGIEREKLISVVTIASIVNAAIWLAVLPYAVDRLGYRGPYLCLLLITLVGTYMLRGLPSLPDRPRSDPKPPRSSFHPAATCVVGAIFLTQLGQGAFWSLEDVFGRRAGLSDHAIGVLLSVATLLLLLGAAASAWITARFGRFFSLSVLIAANAASILLISATTIHWIFISANAVQSITNLSSVICQLGLAAHLDRTGRVVAASTSLVALGNGLGPGLSANLNSTFGATAVGLVVLAFNLAALALFCAVRLHNLKESTVRASLA